MRQAAIEIDGDRLRQLVTEIPPEPTKLADQLRNLVKCFCFDQILELIGQEINE